MTPEELSAQSEPMRSAFIERNSDVDGLYSETRFLVRVTKVPWRY